MAERKYMLRVTRVPLDAHTRERMRHAGTLPDDYLTRALPADDYLEIEAADDTEARRKALEQTALRFTGEKAVIEEVLPNMERRELEEEAT